MFAGTNTYSGATTVIGGTLEISPTGSLTSVTPVTVGGGAGPAALAIDERAASGIQTLSIGSLSLQPSGTVSLAGGVAVHANRMLLSTGTITFAGGRLDLGGNDLIIPGGDIGAVSAALSTGFNAGTWDGAGIDSSAASTDSAHLTAIASMVNNDGHGNAGFVGMFDGVTPAINDVLVKYTLYGDADLSGTVTSNDYTLIDSAFTGGGGTGWQNGDFNYDGVIDGSDYSLIDNAFNVQSTSYSASPAALVASASDEIATTPVPEPTCFSILGLCAFAVTRGRHRRDRT